CGSEIGEANYQGAIDSCMQSLVLDPVRGPQWLVAGSVVLCTGYYAVAQYMFERARQLENIPNLPFHFVGAGTMLGFVHTRQLSWESARQSHLQSLESLRGTEHVYRDVFITLSACGLGEIELRAGHPDEALTRFRHAWRVVREEPRMVGN